MLLDIAEYEGTRRYESKLLNKTIAQKLTFEVTFQFQFFFYSTKITYT